MAQQVVERTIGVDVAKSWLDVAMGSGPVQRIENGPGAIGAWLATLPGPVQLAVEATGRYHEALVQAAWAAGHRVYLVSPLRLSRYREAVGVRAKTDRADAVLLQRYLAQEGAHLVAWSPRSAGSERLWRLLKRRATVVRAQVQLRQSLGDEPALAAARAELLAPFAAVLRRLDRQLVALARELGWGTDLDRLQAVPGIGPVTALGLLAAYRRGDFPAADHFVAYLGLDVRVRDSGRSRGRRRLSKQGEPELRRLLFNAAMAGCRQGRWHRYYQGLRARGLPSTAALMALARKQVRLAFSLLHHQTTFDRARWEACAST